MYIFENRKVHFYILLALAFLQIFLINYTKDPFTDILFTITCAAFFAIGFLSLNFAQFFRNLSNALLPTAVWITVTLMVLTAMEKNLVALNEALMTAFVFWGLLLIIAVPLFILGYVARRIILFYIKPRA